MVGCGVGSIKALVLTVPVVSFGAGGISEIGATFGFLEIVPNCFVGVGAGLGGPSFLGALPEIFSIDPFIDFARSPREPLIDLFRLSHEPKFYDINNCKVKHVHKSYINISLYPPMLQQLSRRHPLQRILLQTPPQEIG